MMEIHQIIVIATIWAQDSHSILEKRQFTIVHNIVKQIHRIHMLHLEQGRAVRILAEHLKKGCTFKRGCTWREKKLTHIYWYTSGMPAQLITHMHRFKLQILILCWSLMWRYSTKNRTWSTIWWIWNNNKLAYIIFSLHTIAKKLGSQRALTLLFLHALSEFDTVSSFFGINKKTIWETWYLMTYITAVASQLNSMES